jgi:hypothetical protein
VRPPQRRTCCCPAALLAARLPHRPGRCAAEKPLRPAPSAAGAPPSNATFFCDSTSSFCYSLLTPLLSQPAAKARCVQMSGQLAAWTDAVKQMEAER